MENLGKPLGQPGIVKIFMSRLSKIKKSISENVALLNKSTVSADKKTACGVCKGDGCKIHLHIHIEKFVAAHPLVAALYPDLPNLLPLVEKLVSDWKATEHKKNRQTWAEFVDDNLKELPGDVETVQFVKALRPQWKRPRRRP